MNEVRNIKHNDDPLAFLGELAYGLLTGEYQLVGSRRISDSNDPEYTDCEYHFVCKSKGPQRKMRAQ